MVTQEEIDIAFLMINENDKHFKQRVKELRNKMENSRHKLYSDISRNKIYQGKNKHEGDE